MDNRHGARDGWPLVADLIEQVIGADDLLPSVVASVRASVPEVAVLPSADIAGHTRALLAAAARALTARRGPTEAELSFVAELALTRARQGIPIEAVLGAIHVAERAIWTRARDTADTSGVTAGQLLDARELYDDWADAVRARLIAAHRTAKADSPAPAAERSPVLLRRLLAGGSAAALAAAEAGLPANGRLWIRVARPADTTAVRRESGEPGAVLSAQIDGLLVSVLAHPPAGTARPEAAGLAGPAAADRLGSLKPLATAALTAAEAAGRRHPVHITEVATLAAITARADLATALAQRHQPARHALGSQARPIATTVRTWLENDRDTAATAGVLFVHPNTIRNRIHRFSQVTGLDPAAPFGAPDAWLLCHTWLHQTAWPSAESEGNHER